jgi:hypothetical protein
MVQQIEGYTSKKHLQHEQSGLRIGADLVSSYTLDAGLAS